MFSCFEIIGVVLVGVSLTLEGYIEVPGSIASVLKDAHDTLQQIKYVEKYIAEFLHLDGVDAFMIEYKSLARSFSEQHAKKIYGIKSFTKRDYAVIYDLHQ